MSTPSMLGFWAMVFSSESAVETVPAFGGMPTRAQVDQQASCLGEVAPDNTIQRVEHVAVHQRLRHVAQGQEPREGVDVAAEAGQLGVGRRECGELVDAAGP